MKLRKNSFSAEDDSDYYKTKCRTIQTTNLRRDSVSSTPFSQQIQKEKHTPSPQRSKQNKPILHHIAHRRPRSKGLSKQTSSPSHKQQCIRSKKAATPLDPQWAFKRLEI